MTCDALTNLITKYDGMQHVLEKYINNPRTYNNLDMKAIKFAFDNDITINASVTSSIINDNNNYHHERQFDIITYLMDIIGYSHFGQQSLKHAICHHRMDIIT